MADNDQNDSQGSPRYVDEAMEANKNLRPDVEVTKERGTDHQPLSEE